MTVPKPWQAGHGRAETTWPRKVRCTDWTSPRPPQVSQVARWVPAAVPAPEQVVQSTAVSTVIGASTPNAVSCRSSSSRRIASAPGRVRGRGPARRRRAAEEGVHDVLEADERAGAAGAARAAAAAGRQRVAAEVDDLPLLGSESTSYAALISLNFSCASGSGLTSGWNWRASLR